MTNTSVKNRILLFLTCLVTVTISACKKDSNNGVSSSDAVKVLTASTWTFVKFDYQKQDGTWVPDDDAADANQFTITFNANGGYTEIDTRNGATSTSTWTFSADKKTLTLSGGYTTDAANYSVDQLSSTSMVLIEPRHVVAATDWKAVKWTFKR